MIGIGVGQQILVSLFVGVASGLIAAIFIKILTDHGLKGLLGVAVIFFVIGMFVTLILYPAPLVEVPHIVGYSEDDAENIIKENDLIFNVIDRRYSDTVQKYKVISQDLPGGLRVKKDSIVGVAISLGPQITPTPTPTIAPTPTSPVTPSPSLPPPSEPPTPISDSEDFPLTAGKAQGPGAIGGECKDGIFELKASLHGGDDYAELFLDLIGVRLSTIRRNPDGTYNLTGTELIAVVRSDHNFKGDPTHPNGAQFLLKNKQWDNPIGTWININDAMMSPAGIEISFLVPDDRISREVAGITLKFTIGSNSKETYEGSFFVQNITIKGSEK